MKVSIAFRMAASVLVGGACIAGAVCLHHAVKEAEGTSGHPYASQSAAVQGRVDNWCQAALSEDVTSLSGCQSNQMNVNRAHQTLVSDLEDFSIGLSALGLGLCIGGIVAGGAGTRRKGLGLD